MLLKCEYLNLLQRLGEVICQPLLTIQSMKGIERGTEKSYFLPRCSTYILFAATAPSKKIKSFSSSSFIFCSIFFLVVMLMIFVFYLFFEFFQECVIHLFRVFCSKNAYVLFYEACCTNIVLQMLIYFN